MIVIAAIALLVLVVISFLFAGKMTFFRQQGETCSSMGGTCKIEGCNPELYEKEQPYLCDLDGNNERNGAFQDGYCCIKV